MIPLLGHRSEDQPVAVFAGRLISASEFMADVHAFAKRLPSRRYAINLCRDRYCFAVAFAAAMLRNQISLLPPSQSPATLEQLRVEYVSVYVMADDDMDRSLESVRVNVGNAPQSNKLASLAFAESTVAAIAFTSGSTGTPVANRKTWGALALGGISEASRFGLIGDTSTIVFGTVPPQHMYGLESTVIMALRGGLIMHNERPFFPADIQHALARSRYWRVLVSTPVHLRALLASEARFPELRLAVCATAPLSREMAEQFETRFETQVHEVYGFTEAGMVATRRTVDGPEWRLLEGLRIREEGGSFLVSGGHVPAEVVFSDLIEVVDAEHFLLQGRHADLVNVAGKRTSIAYLDHQVLAIPGVQDGAFLMPEDTGDKVTRSDCLRRRPRDDAGAIAWRRLPSELIRYSSRVPFIWWMLCRATAPANCLAMIWSPWSGNARHQALMIRRHCYVRLRSTIPRSRDIFQATRSCRVWSFWMKSPMLLRLSSGRTIRAGR